VRIDEFEYNLPEHLIAQTPLSARADSRLMVIDPLTEGIQHTHFSEICSHLRAGDVLVLNDSKVLPARLYGEKQDTGARVELLLLRELEDLRWSAMAKPAKRLHLGTTVVFKDAQAKTVATAVVTGVGDDGIRELTFQLDGEMGAFLDAVGSMPLPPYIHAPLLDRDRYQTVYAKAGGSVAAPTAGLHFTKALLADVQARGVHVHFVTLHVGIGTFRPVQVDTIENHVMHTEWYEVPEDTADAVNMAKTEGRRVIAVGTTALRTLESAAKNGVLQHGIDETGIFIYPGYHFQMVDALITNFHLPKSTLLMLVSALMGMTWTQRVYATAVEQEYRFFSFGDAMFITRRKEC